jgi:hypothetical protein
MKFSLSGYIRAILLLVSLQAGAVLACDAIEDGCLGCTDDELQVCMQVLVTEICDSGGGLAKCDQRRVYDDAERHILTNTGRHMSRVRAMMRSAQKYQLR